MLYDHTKRNLTLSECHTSDDSSVKIEPPTDPCLYYNNNLPDKRRKKQTSKAAKRLKAHTMVGDVQTTKHQGNKFIQTSIKEEPRATEIIIKQEPNTCTPESLQQQEQSITNPSVENPSMEGGMASESSIKKGTEDTDKINDLNETGSLNTKEHERPKSCKGHKVKGTPKTTLNVPNIVSIYCNDCQHNFTTKKRYDAHLKNDRCRHECGVCGKVFLFRMGAHFRDHVKTHEESTRDYQCQTCGKTFITQNYLRMHEKGVHHQVKQSICDVCGKSFYSKSNLESHKNSIHNDNREKRTCPKCPRSFMSIAGYYHHLKTVHNANNNATFPCGICHKVLKSKQNLKAHMVTHKESRNFKCEICSASFKSLPYLNLHKKRHTDAYVTYCSYCQKGFYENRACKDHEYTHTGARPYTCNLCEYSCSNGSNLAKHKKRAHNE